MTHRTRVVLLVVAGLCGANAARARGADDVTFQNRLARWTIGADGRARSLVDKPAGRQWLVEKPPSFTFIKKGGRYHDATSIVRDGEAMKVVYGQSGVTARLGVTVRPQYLVIRLLEVKGGPVEQLCLARLRTRITANAGWWLDVRWNDDYAVCLVGLSKSVQTGSLQAIVHREFGLTGQGVAILAAPTKRLLDVVQTVERDEKLPAATIAGKWAKRSDDIRRGYLFTDLTEANADETLRYATLGEFKYVMTYSGTWSTSLGSYPIRKSNFPRGEASLKATVDKLHAAGLKAGLHMLTSFVGKNDPLVRPVPDRRLLCDAEATLAADVDAKTRELPLSAVPEEFPRDAAYYGSKRQGFDVLVDQEIIRYGAIAGEGGKALTACTRGAHGTRTAPHKAGATVRHLTERYGCYLVDLRTDLKDTVADRIAGVVNRCGFDMIYFDGGECNGANGPYWYWVTHQQLAIYQRFRRDVLVQGSGGTPWTWHFFSRGCCDDFAAVAPKEYLDHHKIRDSWRHYTRSFMPAELGWWGFLADEPHHPATSPDEVEAYAARMLALDSPVSLETNLAALKRHGRTNELLALLGRWERLRLGRTVPDAVRRKLREGEWHLAETAGKPALRPVRYDTQRVATGTSAAVTNPFAAQPMGVRIEAVPALAAPGDANNLALVAPKAPLPVPAPDAKDPMPGARVVRHELTKPANLLKHRPIAVRIHVPAPLPAGKDGPAVLNVQLESTAHRFRDHYIDLDFTGTRTIVLPEPTTRRMLGEFRPAHAAYPFKQAMYGFDYRRILAVGFRWMRCPKGAPATPCTIERVESLAESPTVLANPRIAVGKAAVTLPVQLKTGDYLEWWPAGPIRVFDRNGKTLRTLKPPAAAPALPAGTAKLTLNAKKPAAAKLTVITQGKPLTW